MLGVNIKSLVTTELVGGLRFVWFNRFDMRKTYVRHVRMC